MSINPSISKTKILEFVETFVKESKNHKPVSKETLNELTSIFKNQATYFAPSDIKLLKQTKKALKNIDSDLSERVDTIVKSLKSEHHRLEDFPAEVLDNIAQFLPIKDRARLREQGKFFKDTIETKKFAEESLNASMAKIDRNSLLAFLKKHGKNIESLDLTSFKAKLNKNDMAKIAKYCPNLKDLTADCDDCSAASFLTEIYELPLKSLTLYNAGNIFTDSRLSTPNIYGTDLLKKMSSLELLDIRNGRLFRSDLVKAISELPLKALSIGVREENEIYLLTLSPSLEFLKISSPHITDGHLGNIEISPNLKHLVIASPKISDTGIEELKKRFPSLEIEKEAFSREDWGVHEGHEG